MDFAEVSELLGQPWSVITAELEKPDKGQNAKQELQVKFLTTESSYFLLVTDLVHVWYRRSDANDIESERKAFASSMKKQSISRYLSMLETLLVKDSNGYDDKTHVMSVSKQGVLTLKSRLMIQVYPFQWEFECSSYGNAEDQAALLRDHMYKPCFEIIKLLSYQLQQEKKLARDKSSLTSAMLHEPPPEDYYTSFSLGSVWAHGGGGSGVGGGSGGSAGVGGMMADLYRGAVERLTLSQMQFDFDTAEKPSRSSTGRMQRVVPADEDAFDWLREGEDRSELDEKHVALPASRSRPKASAASAAAALGSGARGDYEVPVARPAAAPAAADDGKYVETEAEIKKREEIAKRLEAEKKKKKRKAFV